MKKYFLMGLSLVLPLTPLAASKCSNAFPYPISKHTDNKVLGEIGFDKLRITGIIIGILPYEREIPQDILVTMRASTNLSEVVSTDELDSTVDYVKLAEIIEKEARDSKSYFIDVLAIKAVQKVFDAYPEVETVFIQIEKPKALPNARSGGIVQLTLTKAQLEAIRTNPDEPVIAEIGYDDLYVETIIGDLEIERANKQPIIASLRVSTDIRPLLQNNPLEINYVELALLFERKANEGKYYMFETLATLYLNEVFKKYPNIECAHIKLNKPGSLPGYPFKTNAITEVTLTKSEA